MQAENWDKVKEMLREVLQLEPLKRGAFLEKAETTVEIRAEVESLLAFEAESEDFMSLPITDFSKDFLAEDEEIEISLVGQKIGIYEITEELGYGGMGAVYLAARNDGKFEQKVAIKMLKREFNVEKIRRNFKREREIQSKLNHPNIARLLDAGTTDDGVPYLVMEYIEGSPIDKYCENKNLSLTARLKLFNKICEAVSFAHQNLIIHRDLKPSNILVTEKGESKLLDFGISKLLGAEDLEDKTTITLRGAMTPEYASPEQIKGETVTTATDIYSLGVVLYKILTNSHPFDLKGKTNGELLKTISESEPITPSAVSSAERWSVVSGQETNRKSQIANRKFLKGDIDNIILKSLRKEPGRRYQTVEQFSADIWRFIDGIPILARPATVSYRASKFYQRNKVSVIAGIFIILSLLTGIVVAVWQANAAREQARIAGESQKLAELKSEKAIAEEEKAKKISGFMSKIISYANPAWYAEGGRTLGEAKVIDVLNEMGAKIDGEFPDEIDIQAELHHKFAEVYTMIKNPGSKSPRAADAREKALFHARRALELRKQFYGEHHELVAKDLYYLWAAAEPGKPNEAAVILAQAIQMMREMNPKNLNLPYMLSDYANRLSNPDNEEFKKIYLQSALPPTKEGNYQLAERFYKEALPIFREHYKEDNQAIIAQECHLAFVLIKQNKFTEFDEHYQICQQAADKLEAESGRKLFDRIKEVLAENNR